MSDRSLEEKVTLFGKLNSARSHIGALTYYYPMEFSNEVNARVASALCFVSDSALAPYYSTLTHPKRFVSAFRNLVKDNYELATDILLLEKGIINKITFGRKVSHSLAFAELLAVGGASLVTNYVPASSHSLQSFVGGFIGSEPTTFIAFFLTYLAQTRAINHRQGTSTFLSDLKEASKVTATTVPAGLGTFFIANTVMSAGSEAVKFIHPQLWAGAAAFLSALIYTPTAKAAIHTSAENGYINKA